MHFYKKFQYIIIIFHDFPGPWLFSMTFQAWKMVLLNSRTFHDFPGRVVTLLKDCRVQTIQKCTQTQSYKARTHFYRKWKPLSYLFTSGKSFGKLVLTNIVQMTIGQYQRTSRLILIIGKMADTDTDCRSIIGASLVSSVIFL